MATVPIEVVVSRDHLAGYVASAVALVNAAQNELAFSLAENEFQLRMEMRAYELANAEEILNQIDVMRSEVRGYHPFIIAVVDSALNGKFYGNLFGTHRASSGLAVVTTAQVADAIIPRDRMVAYIVYYFARYALSFLAPGHRNHEDTRACIFDRKALKTDIVSSMRAGALCDECRHRLVKSEGTLSPRQFAALDQVLALSGRILNDGINRGGRPRIFIGSSSEGLAIANKIQQLLSGEFSVVVWNQGTIFGLGHSTLEALEHAVLEYHNGIFVFTPDDELSSRGEVRHVARDNVIFELGMFVGKLGRTKAFVLQPGRQKIALPTDLSGITTAIYDPDEPNITAALGAPANLIREAIRGAMP